jgi:hypothetical protein
VISTLLGFLKLLNPVTLLWGVLALSLTATGAGLYGVHKGVQKDRARSDLMIAKMQLDAATQYNQVLTSYRALEQGMNAVLKEKQDEYNALRVKSQAQLEAVRRNRDADAVSVRKWAEGFIAEHRGPATADSPAADSRDAETLGGVLAQCLSVQEELAGAAEGNADAVRTLLAAWPVTPASPKPK